MTSINVSRQGKLTLPSDALRRWNLTDGGAVQMTDLGFALLLTPVGHPELKRRLADAVDRAGGYAALVDSVLDDESGLS